MWRSLFYVGLLENREKKKVFLSIAYRKRKVLDPCLGHPGNHNESTGRVALAVDTYF